MNNPWLDSPLVQSIGWALIHFIWQGTAIGVVTAITLHALAGARPALRYAVACSSLAVMFIVPVVTVLTGRVSDALPLASAAVAPVDLPVPVDRLLPSAVVAWLAGVLLLSVRLTVACAGVERLKRATRAVDATVVARVQSLARRFSVDRPVRVLESTLVRVPTVVGHLRPVILLPASVITGLAPAHLEAVLAHELAHVRRHDYLVNAWQSLVETLLFYHPAVWWCSRQIRIERELCCDDMVVGAGGDRLAYATALAQLEELRGREPMLSLTASGGRLVDRIRRLLAESPKKERRSTMWTLAAALAVVTALAVTAARSVADASEFTASVQSAPLSPVPPLPQAPPARPAAPVVPPAPAAVPVAPVPPGSLPPPSPLTAPAPPGSLAPQSPPSAPLPPVPPLSGDETDIAQELNRAAAELMKGFEEVQRAMQEIALRQAQLEETRLLLERMKNEVLAKHTDIEAIRRAIAELSDTHAAAAQPDMAEMRKRIEAIMREMQTLRAR